MRRPGVVRYTGSLTTLYPERVSVSHRKPCRLGKVQSFLREHRQEKYAARVLQCSRSKGREASVTWKAPCSRDPRLGFQAVPHRRR